MSIIRLVRADALRDSPATNSLSSAVAQTASAGLLVQSYCTQVAQQPIVVIPDSVKSKLPDINAFLKTAQDNASDYLTNIQPKILLVVTDVGGYSTEFASFYNVISGKIASWKAGNIGAKADVLALLGQLKIDLDKKLTNVNGVRNSITGFQGKLNTDVSNFNNASTQANIIIGGDQGALADLDHQISDINGRIAGAAVGVALSGLTVIGGALMIAAGSIASFITAGTSTVLVVAGVAVVVVGAAGLTASSMVLSSLIGAKSNLIEQKAQLNADLKFLTDFKGTIGTLSSAAATASQQLTNMSNAWGILSGNLGNVVDSVGSARLYSDLPIVVQVYLDTAQNQWADVKTAVKTIEQQMTGVQTRVLKDAGGGLAKLTPAALQNLRAA